jgi:hypothetical protein
MLRSPDARVCRRQAAALTGVASSGGGRRPDREAAQLFADDAKLWANVIQDAQISLD